MMITRVRGLAALAGALTLTVSGQTKGQLEPSIPVVRFENVPLYDAIQNLARRSAVNYILSPAIPNRAVTFHCKNLSAKATLTKFLAENHLLLIENSATTVAHVSTTNRIESPVDVRWIAADTNTIIPLIQFEWVPLQVTLTELGKRAGLQTVVDLKVTGSSPVSGQQNGQAQTVSVYWNNLKPRQAIGAICENFNLVLVEDSANAGIRITSK